jgi:16S rRNA (cytosine1407-C5)-methyltransferase
MPINKLLPTQFLDHITPQLPSHLSIDDLIITCHQALRFSIRVNTLKISVAEFCTLMTNLSWLYQPIPWCDTGFWIQLPQDAIAPGKLPEHICGLFYIQEASSMLPPVALFSDLNGSNNKFDMVLDLAAAPGSKTTQIAALMANQGLLVANEYSSSRIKALHSNLQRMGVSNTLISHFDGHVHGDYLENSFDAVLIDAPCSGEGTVRKDPDAFKNWSIEHVHEVSTIQRGLLRSAFMALKPGGELVYSTCALNFIENQQVCQSLLDEFDDSVTTVDLSRLFDGADKAVTKQGYLHIWPQIYDSEGFFIAKFKKLAATAKAQPKPFKNKFPFSQVSGPAATALLSQLSQLGLTGIEQHNLYQREQEIWFFPSAVKQLTSRMRFQRLGVKLLEQKAKNTQLEHDAAIIFSQPQVELSKQQLIEYIKGRDIQYDNQDNKKGIVYLGYQQQTIGMGKWVGNKIKNKLPRTLVNDHVAAK